MSVKVVARIRPFLRSELEKDNIIQAISSSPDTTLKTNVIRIPNPRNPSENYSFQFNSVYTQEATQQEVFEEEVAPTIKHLFNGFDITIFAYGVTGSGKTHTMRGGKTLADRGTIPRLLSGIYRRGRRVEKDSNGETRVEVSMSYYEIYNDRVYDLFEPPEQRTAMGLPIRDNNGKTVVAGLSERPCTTLKEFEHLYDLANLNRSTSATKLNAHSSRSHAILSVKVTQIKDSEIIISTASAIDLAGSEDNRRTGNDKERLVESSSINKSLFVLAQCVEAISKKQNRIPYRESKMTRILSLGQSNGLTIMILNLAPTRSYHLDTLSSLNFANRTKKIEVREVENEPISRGPPLKKLGITTGPSLQRAPLRPLAANTALATTAPSQTKLVKAFAVYAEKSNPRANGRDSDTLKRSADAMSNSTARPNKIQRTSGGASSTVFQPQQPTISRSDIEALVNQMVDEKLANRALDNTNSTRAASAPLNNELQQRLDALEQRIGRKEDERAEGLQFLLMAKQHQARGEDASALKMFQLALPFFPSNEKLAQRMLALQNKLKTKKDMPAPSDILPELAVARQSKRRAAELDDADESYHEAEAEAQYKEVSSHDELSPTVKHKRKRARRTPAAAALDHNEDEVGRAPLQGDQVSSTYTNAGEHTPRTGHILSIINSRDASQIKALKGLGAKKAEAVVNFVCSLAGDEEEGAGLSSLAELESLKGFGGRTVEALRAGVVLGF